MATKIKEVAKQALDELPEDEATEVLDFIGYLRWRREETDQSWFWTEEWQSRYREAKANLTEGRFRDFDDIEDESPTHRPFQEGLSEAGVFASRSASSVAADSQVAERGRAVGIQGDNELSGDLRA